MIKVNVPEAIYLSPQEPWPNSPQPVLLYRCVVQGDELCAKMLQDLFALHGWPLMWRDTIYDYFHYHASAHECLGVIQGNADLKFGGEKGPIFNVTAGDVLVLPAGVAHRRVNASPDFLLIGAYPVGQSPDLKLGKADERPTADLEIGKLPIPFTDPVQGAGGDLIHLWSLED